MNNNSNHYFGKQDAELRWAFTAYMEHAVRNARLDYINKVIRLRKRELLVADIPELYDNQLEQPFIFGQRDFEFEEEHLSRSFQQLPLLKKRILYYSFCEDLSTSEIAIKLNCSPGYISVQKYRALQKLRMLIK